MLHLVERLHQLSHFIPVWHGQVLPAEIISGDLAGVVGHFHHGRDQRRGQQPGQPHDNNHHDNGKNQNQIRHVVEYGNLFLIAGVSVLQRNLHQPPCIVLKVGLHGIDPVELGHKAVLLRVHFQKQIPGCAVALIPVAQVPGPGVPLLADLAVAEGQGEQAAFGPDAGQHVLLAPLLRPAPDIGLEGADFQLQGFLEIMAAGIVLQYYIETVQGKVHDAEIEGNRQPHDQNDHGSEGPELFLQRDCKP